MIHCRVQFVQAFFGALLSLVAATALAAPELHAPLPSLEIEERGELFMQGDDFEYRPWSTQRNPGTVHVLQFFNGTMGDSKIFEPFTDRLQEVYAVTELHVSTVINLDAALWGTTGFVVSEVKKNKKKYPHSTLVLDAEGKASREWALGEQGSVLVIVDPKGVVQYMTREAMSDEEIQAGIELVGQYVVAAAAGTAPAGK